MSNMTGSGQPPDIGGKNQPQNQQERELNAVESTRKKRTDFSRRNSSEMPIKADSSLGGRVRRMRLQKGLSMTALVEKTNRVANENGLYRTFAKRDANGIKRAVLLPPLTEAQLSRLEMDDAPDRDGRLIVSSKETRTNTLLAMAIALDCSCDYLLGRKNYAETGRYEPVKGNPEAAELMDIFNQLTSAAGILLLEYARYLKEKSKADELQDRALEEVKAER